MILFIWIPKTAGTSIADHYRLKIYLDNYREFNNDGNVTFGHIDVKLLLRAGVISKDYWEQAYKFTVVRNPYDRFISLYNDFKRSGRIDSRVTELRFAHTLQNVTRKPGLYNTLDFSQCASQMDWILPGIVIRRFEDIDVSPHLNKSEHAPWQKYYNSELVRIVTDLYLDDFILLNYEMI
jgi:Sulfotransferase family